MYATLQVLPCNNSCKSLMRLQYFFYSILIIYFLVIVIKDNSKLRKDLYCKESLFLQIIFKQCTPRNFNYDNDKQKSI